MAHVGRTTRLGTGAQAAPPPGGRRLGEVLAGRYRLDTLVGWGGQALVYSATDLQARTGSPPLAIKLARRDLAADAAAEAVTVLRWEAYLLRKLRHPALPRLQRFHSDSQNTWLAREMVQGMALGHLVRNGPVAPNIVQSWAVQLCDLLTYLHTQAPPVVCGDLKPANLVLQADGRLLLIDLGAAQTLTRQPPRKARPRHGTPGYAPPEQLGSWGYDERSDLFALAATCYEWLTGLDPANAPLQFELDRLDAVAPQLAPALRWALALDRQARCPNAASLRARLVPTAPPTLRLSYGAKVSTRQELLDTTMRHPKLIDEVLRSGDLQRWLGAHSDHQLGMLLYELRKISASARKNQPPVELLLGALAPVHGNTQLSVAPLHVNLGRIPLKSWRMWSKPAALVIANHGRDPARWEVECAVASDAEIRILLDGKAQRKAVGALAPGGKVRLELVANGRQGLRKGTLLVRSGNHATTVSWEGVAQPGLAVAGQFVETLAELDLSRAQLVLSELEALFVQGNLSRWLRAQGQGGLAKELDDLLKTQPDQLAIRQTIARVLHGRDPQAFPLVAIYGISGAANVLCYAGQPDYLLLEVENLGATAFTMHWASRHPWAQVALPAGNLLPRTRMHVPVRITPPANAAPGRHPIALELQAGALTLPVIIHPQVTAESWWQRLRRWVAG
jgi:serine/threonine protein kinase